MILFEYYMSKDKKLDLEFLSWKEARSHLSDINQELCRIIDDWDPDERFGFYKASYKYGDLLLDEGKLRLPMPDGDLVFISDNCIPQKIRDDLSYSSFPIGFPLQKATEVYIELNQRVIPLVVFPAGVPLGLLETLDPIESCCIRNIWNVSIGSRSAFMLPKISDRKVHDKLAKEFGLSTTKPNSQFDHFKIFKELSRSIKFMDDSWHCDILFLNKKWFDRDEKNYHWLRFNNYLNEYMVRYSSYTRNKSTVDVMYQLLVRDLEIENKKTFPHLFDALKNIVSILVGATPGFRPAFGNDDFGPFTTIQKIYLEYYSIEYCPTIMTPHLYNFSVDNRPTYYSISQPSMFETSPRSRKLESYIDDLYQLRLLFETFINLVKKGSLRIDGTIIEKAIRNTSIDYFHASDERKYNGIKSASIMADCDYTLNSLSIHDKAEQRRFSEVNSFTRSCIRLTSVKN